MRKSTITTFVLGGLVSSELMYLIKLENQRKDFLRKTNAEIKICEDVLQRVGKGEKVDLEAELMEKKVEDNFEKILADLTSMDDKFANSVPVGQGGAGGGSGSGWL